MIHRTTHGVSWCGGDVVDALRRNAATIVVGVLVVGAIVTAYLLLGLAAGCVATSVVIHDGDGSTRTLPLDDDARIEVATSFGTNVIVIENGTARVAEADCPKGSCMHQRPISRPGEQLVCLPHRLWVEIADNVADGSKLDEDAVKWEDDAEVDLVSR